MEKKIRFIYLVRPLCSRSSPYITTDPNIAEQASKNNCRVTCSGKVYKRSNN